MLTKTHVGAAAPGPVTPAESDEAPGLPGPEGFKRLGSGDAGDSAAELPAVVWRLAVLGIVARRLNGGAWLLRHARGATIGIVHGFDALAAAVSGFKAAHDDVHHGERPLDPEYLGLMVDSLRLAEVQAEQALGVLDASLREQFLDNTTAHMSVAANEPPPWEVQGGP